MLFVIGAIALALHFRSTNSDENSWTIAQHNGRRALDMSNFAKIPGSDSEQIIEQTASVARTLEPVSATEAQAANARIATTSDTGPAAFPLMVPLDDGVRYIRALDCMTAAVYYEAANEPLDGQRAVAQVVMNRSRHLVYPHTICGVVYQGAERATGCQFSFTCDGSLQRTPSVDGWRRARSVASAALGGLVYAPVGLATHYHADYVLPYWAPKLVKQKVIGRHIFYRWPGTWGTRPSFAASYDRDEPDVFANHQLADTMSGTDGAAPLVMATIQDTKERPILMGGSLPTAPLPTTTTQTMVAGGVRRVEGRNYLMSKEASPPPAQNPVPPPRRGVTGGVLMPGSTIGETIPNNAGTAVLTPRD